MKPSRVWTFSSAESARHIPVAGLEDDPIRFASIPLLALLLASCGTAMDLLDRETPKSDTLLQITETGVGQLNGGVPYTEAAVTAALPGTRARNVLIGLETETRNAIVLFQQSEGVQVQLLQVVGSPGGKVAEIHGVSHHVVGPSGERPGMTLSQTGTDPASCRAGTHLWLGLAVCAARGAPNVHLLFSLGGDAATSASLPSPDKLEAGELQQVIWTSDMPKTGKL